MTVATALDCRKQNEIMEITARLLSALQQISILPRRMKLDTPGVAATVPMLRGVWGAALRDLDPLAYSAVFETPQELGEPRPNGYVLRPALPDPEFAPAVEWILIGDAIQFDEVLRRAWDIASGMGLGPRRQRFHIRAVRPLGPDDQAPGDSRPWPLSQATWPWPKVDRPCRLSFPAPLRILRHKALIETPTLTDLVVAAGRRVRGYLPADRCAEWDALTRELVDVSRSVPAGGWHGERLDFQRYSGRQQAEVEQRGVSGSLELPQGPGPLWPLLAAAQWLHIGKGTVMGLGQLRVEPMHEGQP